MSTEKILSLEEIAAATRSRDGALVLCHGTYDLLHVGHMRHLERARREGALLVVTITGDDHINRGPGRPVFNERLRAEALAALACVDYVAICDFPTALEAIAALRPDVYAKGAEYRDEGADVTGNIAREREAVEALGGRLFFTDEITFSSSALLNATFDLYPPGVKAYLSSLKGEFDHHAVIRALNGLRQLQVLVVGDTIVDEYHYTEGMGQTGKSSVLAVRYRDREQFAGGAVAVANHLAQISDRVTLVSGLGEHESHEAFVRSRLEGQVTAHFFTLPGERTLVKRRYLNEASEKLFEVYFGADQPMAAETEARVCDWLEENLARFDVVVVPDFGNGFITDAMVERLCAKAPFLAVNTQVNSGNRGFHFITRYPRADFVSLNEPELRMGLHQRYAPLEAVAGELAERLGARLVAVTRGVEGVMLLDREAGELHAIPALTRKVVDRIGAGDAFLAFSAAALGGAFSPPMAGFIGAAAAALDIQIVCNREPVRLPALGKYVTTLLK